MHVARNSSNSLLNLIEPDEENSLSLLSQQSPQSSASRQARAGAGTRSSANWSRLPGSFDELNTHMLFPALDGNVYDIPTIRRDDTITQPQWLIKYGDTRLRNPQKAAQGALHFFRDDYRFVAAWSRPYQVLQGLISRGYGSILSPDFSLYRDWPIAAQIWNVYRSRWCGAFWQLHGLKVIPTISWADRASFDFCFAGLEPGDDGGMVAIATVQIKDATARRLFEAGYLEMLDRVQPSKILCYRQLESRLVRMAEARIGAEVVVYAPAWEEERAEWGDRAPLQKPDKIEPLPLWSDADFLEEEGAG